MENSTCAIDLTVNPNQIPFFFKLLRKGILIHIETDLCAREFICDRLGVEPEYMDKQIQTIFLDGKLLDDRNAAVIKGGSTLAISAAMPGMVGATFRSGGFYATFRSPISHDGVPVTGQAHTKPVLLKCFNKISNDVGPMLLERGIWVTGQDFKDLVVDRMDDFQKGPALILLDHRSVDPGVLKQMKWKEKQIFLKVKAA